MMPTIKLFIFFFSLSFIFYFSVIQADEENYLRNNLNKANAGDYIVTAQNKSYTLLHIYNRDDNILAIEEISVPANKINLKNFSWKNWVANEAPGNTSWIMYAIEPSTGKMKEAFSFTKNGWYNIPEADNFLSTLLNLQLTKIHLVERKRIGPKPDRGAPDTRPLWQPKMIVEGKPIDGVYFDAWKTRWPKDGGELSGRTIEMFIPEENDKYPAYFPYWLQISGMIGKAKVRIIDSGSGLVSPKPSLNELKKQSRS